MDKKKIIKVFIIDQQISVLVEKRLYSWMIMLIIELIS